MPGVAGAPPRRLPGPTRQRRPGLIVTLVLVVAGFATVGGWLVGAAGDTTEVLVAARPVPAGHPITTDDLSSARLSATGLRAIAAGDVASVAGQIAAVPLVAGQLLNRDMLTGQAVPDAGAAMVGLSFAAGSAARRRAGCRRPGTGVRRARGGHLRSGARHPAVLADQATVYAVRADDTTGGNTALTLVVTDREAGLLAAYGSAGRLAVAKVPGR
jgi:hypothetical protein